jgi:hypothetical protein
MAARGARLRKYGVGTIHRAAEKRRTVGSCISEKEQQALIYVGRPANSYSGRTRVPSILMLRKAPCSRSSVAVRCQDEEFFYSTLQNFAVVFKQREHVRHTGRFGIQGSDRR